MKRIIMEGRTFPQGTKVLEFLYSKNDQSYYLCQCTNCGNKYRQDGYSTRIGRQGCKYCRKREDWALEIKNEPYEIGDLTRQWWSKRIINVLKKRRHKNPDFEYNLTMEYAWNLFLEQNSKCAYTNMVLTFPETGTIGGTASLDRINSNKGYIKGNVQWVHVDINNMKNNQKESRFLYLCKLVTLNRKLKL